MNLATVRQQTAEALLQGELARAVELLQSAVQQHPDVVALYHELAECHWASYAFDRAMAVYEDAHRVRPETTATCTLAAKKLFGLARFEESVRWLQRALESAPKDVPLLAMLAEVLDRSNHLPEAEKCARAALDLDPSHVRSLRILAHLERRQGRIADARRRLEERLRGHPGPDDWRLRYELASVLDQLEDYPGAMRELLRAKDQLREEALPLLDEARTVRHRQQELADLLTRADFEAWRSARPSGGENQPLALLCGHPRSGTTLLERMLGMHDQVITTDETGILQREFIQPLLRDAASPADSAAELRSLDTEQISAGRDAYRCFTEAHLGEPIGTRLLVEKDPALTPDLPLPLRLFPEARVLFPLRDPRDVCLSYFFTLVPLAPASAAALDLRSTCEFCAHSLRLWTHWKQTLPFPLLETRYESLVSDPERETRRILEFLDLPWTPSLLAFHQRTTPRGVRTPTYADVAQPVHRRAVGRWKNYEAFLQPHLKLLQPHLRSFGYD